MRVLRASADCLEYIDFNIGRVGQIHSVFDKAVNLLFDDGTLMTVVADVLELAPMTCQIKKEDMMQTKFQPMDIVVVQKGTIELSNVCADFSSATSWNPKWSNTEAVSKEELQNRFEHFLNRLINQGKREGFLPYLNASFCLKILNRNAFSIPGNRYVEFAEGRLNQFVSAYRNSVDRSDSIIVRDFGKIVGFGPGLTPSSDDFIAGFMAMTLLCPYGRPRNKEDLIILNQIIVKEAKGRTTIVGEALLYHAARGYVAEKYHKVFDQLLYQTEPNLDRAIDAALLHGDTSGTDFLTGVAVAMLLSLNEPLRRR